MYNEGYILKSLRYVALFAIIYLLFRYFPYSRMESTHAVIAALLIIILCLLMEKLCFTYLIEESKESKQEEPVSSESLLEKFNGGCSTCQAGEQPKKTCRVVCDVDDKVKEETETKKTEGFEGTAIGPNDKMPDNNKDLPVKNVQVKPEEMLRAASSDDESTYTYSNRARQDIPTNNYGGMFYDEWPDYNRFNNQDALLANIGQTAGGSDYRIDEDDVKRMKREMDQVLDWDKQIEERARSVRRPRSSFQRVGDKSEVLKVLDNNRRIEGELDNELPYTDYNHLPVAAGYKSTDYEFGYSYIPPELWFPTPPRPPICVTEKRCPIMPVLANGTPADVKEFHASRRILPPDRINTDYIDDKLNSGR